MPTPTEHIRVMRVIARMNVGGPAVQVTGLMRYLDSAQFEHKLVTGYCAPDEVDYLETQAPDVVATRIEGLGRSIRALDDLRALVAIRCEIRRFRPHIVHTHTAKAGVLGRIAAMTVRPRPRLVHTFHGHLLHGYFGPLGTRLLIWVERGLGWITDTLVAVGPEVRDDLLRAGIGRPDRFEVVEPGLELRARPTPAEARERFGMPQKAPVVSVLGRITAIKRPDRMLDVVAAVSAAVPNVLVLVAGDGDLRTSTEAAAVRRALPIRFVGWREDVEHVLAASDVTLMTSDNEGTPLSIIQAAMLGVPAVSTDVGSVRHVINDGETGWVVGRDVQSLAAATRMALTRPLERSRRGQAAQQWALPKFGVQRLANDYASIYAKLAARSR